MDIRKLVILLLLMAFALASVTAGASPRSRRWTPQRAAAVSRAAAQRLGFNRDTVEVFYYGLDSVVMAPRHFDPIPASDYGPVVFDRYQFLDTLSVNDFPMVYPSAFPASTLWLTDELTRRNLINLARQQYVVDHADSVQYNMEKLPAPPPVFKPKADPRQHKFHIPLVSNTTAAENANITLHQNKQHWINTLETSLQFSESYISPNWYQGGSGNINGIGNIVWTNKLNPTFHPKLLFETTIFYKLALNNAPDDSLHTYNISEDIFRINSKFGFKAFNDHWFYSVTLQFKTQFLHSYTANTTTMKAAFLSPGELNIGLGMTYNYVSGRKKLTFDASLAPIAWNLKTCTYHRVNPADFGIKEGRHTVNQLGSTAECKMTWNIAANISYTSRLYLFTNYKYAQGDWENTFKFDINRFLSSQLYVHLRYDSSTTGETDGWRYWQFKEILSLGFSYKFNSGV